jgi:hypothetical protein
MFNIKTSQNETHLKQITYGLYNEHSLRVDQKVIHVHSSTFTQNYAGYKGSGLNLLYISTSKVKLSNLTLTNNTGAFSLLEAEHKLPFYEMLTNKRFKLNFF